MGFLTTNQILNFLIVQENSIILGGFHQCLRQHNNSEMSCPENKKLRKLLWNKTRILESHSQSLRQIFTIWCAKKVLNQLWMIVLHHNLLLNQSLFVNWPFSPMSDRANYDLIPENRFIFSISLSNSVRSIIFKIKNSKGIKRFMSVKTKTAS